jgi:sugar phosphate isomerase/epimerase
MKIGFASLVGLEPKPLDEVVVWAGTHDFDGIEINVGSGYPAIGNAWYPGHLDLETLASEGTDARFPPFDDWGGDIFALAPMLNLLTRDEDLLSSRYQEMMWTIEAAAAVGCDTVVTFAGSADGMHFYGLPGVGDGHSSNKVRENIERFAAVYTPLAAMAERLGVRIAFETAGRGGGEGNIAHNPEPWDAMFEAVPSPAIGLSFDPSHLVWLHIPDIPGLIRQYGSRIYHVDGKDCEILPDRLARQGILGSDWWRYRLPGQGQLDWPAIIAALHDIGYDGPITIEQEDPVCPGYEGVAVAGEYLREIICSTIGDRAGDM